MHELNSLHVYEIWSVVYGFVECKGACDVRQLLTWDFWLDPIDGLSSKWICSGFGFTNALALTLECRSQHTHTSINNNNKCADCMHIAQYAYSMHNCISPYAVAILFRRKLIIRYGWYGWRWRERYVFSRQHSRFRNQCKCGFWRANTKLLIRLKLLYWERGRSVWCACIF